MTLMSIITVDANIKANDNGHTDCSTGYIAKTNKYLIHLP